MRGNLVATGIGSLPHSGVGEAVAAVLSALPELPFCPQLPRVDAGEAMYEQVSAGIPGLRRQDGRLWVDTGPAGLAELADLRPEPPVVRVHPLAAAQELLAGDLASAVGLKAQLAGPISLGLALADQDRRPLLYNPDFMLAAAQVLAWKAGWLESLLATSGRATLIWVDEPYLHTLGSGHFAYGPQLVTDLLQLVLGGLSGLKGIHCCGNTDWPLLLDLDIDVLSFDAVDHFRGLSLYPEAVAGFLSGGGNLAWGIVPVSQQGLETATASGLAADLGQRLQHLESRGVPGELLLSQSLVTPACGMASLAPALAERALRLAGEVASLLRREHGLPGPDLGC